MAKSPEMTRAATRWQCGWDARENYDKHHRIPAAAITVKFAQILLSHSSKLYNIDVWQVKLDNFKKNVSSLLFFSGNVAVDNFVLR